jgi:hypothetical protein
MVEYSSGTLVAVRPFVQRPDGDATIIGDVDRKVYLAIPTEGIDILNALAAGKTVGEAARIYEEKYQEQVDIDDFLKTLEQEGFVSPASAAPDDAHAHQHKQIKSFSFDWISPAWAKRLTGKTVFFIGMALIALGLALLADDPALMPTSKALVFEGGNFAVLMIVTFIVAMMGVSIHEIAHATAARSVGVSATLGISNLMWVLVAQTDISGIWMVSRGARIKAYLAGFFIDLSLSSLLVIYLHGARNGYLPTSNSALLWASAVLATFLFRIVFQFFFYLRTDIYYVLATLVNAKNLMADTERLLNNVVKRLTFRRDKVISQAGIPRRERRWVRVYAVVWVFGRIFALFALAFTILPVLWVYIEQVYFALSGQPHRFTTADFFVIVVLSFLVTGGGLILWMVNLIREALGHRRDARRGVVRV